MASTHMNSMLAITWNLNDNSTATNATKQPKQSKSKRKAQPWNVIEFAPRYQKTPRDGALDPAAVNAPVALQPVGAPAAAPAFAQPPVTLAPVPPVAPAANAAESMVATWWPAPKGNNEPPRAGDTPKVQWANTMGRSKKSKEVEAKNRVATIEYEQQLLAHRRVQEAAHNEAVKEQQQRIAEHISHAAARLVAFITQQQGKGAASNADAAAAAATAAAGASQTEAPDSASAADAPGAPGAVAAPTAAWDESIGHDYAAPPLEPLLDQTSLDAAFPSMESILKYFADVGAGPLQDIIAGPDPVAPLASLAATAAAPTAHAVPPPPAATLKPLDIPVPALEPPSSPKGHMNFAPWPVRRPDAIVKSETSSSIDTAQTDADDALHAELERHSADAMMQLDLIEDSGMESGDELGPTQLLNLIDEEATANATSPPDDIRSGTVPTNTPSLVASA